MNVREYIINGLREGRMHFSLIDPDNSKMPLDKLSKTVAAIGEAGTDLILVGGSTNVETDFLDESVKTIKSITDKPVVIFPGGLSGISRYADAILFMSLMNSTDPFWLVRAQSKAAPVIKQAGIEPIPMAYLVVEPGMEAGRVGKAELIKRDEPEKAAQYALAAQYFGMKLVYLEAGSGADTHVPAEMVMKVKESIDVPLIVGGGIRTENAAKEIANAGADIIVTGTIIENNGNVGKIINAFKS